MKQKQIAAKEARPCAHSGCIEPAVIVRQFPTGWAEICEKHDLFHVQQESNEFCRNNGLDTYEKARDWILAKLASSRPSPSDHWEHVLASHDPIPLAYEYARKYLNRHPKINAAPPAELPAGQSETGIPALSGVHSAQYRQAGAAPDEETEAAFKAYLAETAIPESDYAPQYPQEATEPP